MFTELKRVIHTKQGKKLIVIMLVPILYAAVFLIANWNPYGRTDNLPVALVNADRPSFSEGKTMEIGKELIDKLEEDRQLDWHYPTNLSVALTDLDNGKYYMVIYLPPDFSEKATTLMDAEPQEMPIHYYKNGGQNYMGEKITDGAAAQLEAKISQAITKGYAEAMLGNIATMRQGMAKVAGGAKRISGGAGKLQAGTEQLSQSLNILADKTTLLKDGSKELHNGTERLKDSLSALADGVERLDNGSATLNSGLQRYASGVSVIKEATSQFAEGSGQLRSGVQQYTAGVDSVSGGLTRIASGSSKLESGSQTLYEGLDTYTSGVDTLASGANKISQGMQQLYLKTGVLTDETGLPKLIAMQQGQSAVISSTYTNSRTLSDNLKVLDQLLENMDPDSMLQARSLLANTIMPQTETISSTLENVSGSSQTLSMIFGDMSKSLPVLSNGLTNLRDGTQNIASGTSKLAKNSGKLLDGAGQLRDGMGQLSGSIHKASSGTAQLSASSGKLRNGSVSLNEGLVALDGGMGKLSASSNILVSGTSGLNQALHSLNGKMPQLMNGITKLNDGTETLANNTKVLNDGVNKLANATQTLNTGAETMVKGTGNLANVLDESAEHLQSIQNGDKNVEMFSKPTVLEEHAISSVPNGGYGLAPYILALALYIGALVTIMQVPALYMPLHRPKSALQWLGSKLPLVLMSSLGQITLLITIMFLLGLKPAHLPAMVLVAFATSLAFMTIILFFVSVCGEKGMTLAMLLLIFQLSGSGGTFPMELMAPFFQTIHPFLPMSYGIDGFREALFLQGQIGSTLTVLFSVVLVGVLLMATAFRSNLRRNPSPAIPYSNDLVSQK